MRITNLNPDTGVGASAWLVELEGQRLLLDAGTHPKREGRPSLPLYGAAGNAEVDAIVAAPNQMTPRGRRDRVFLLFLARTGARVSEATGVNANDLHLERGRPQVLLHGKGASRSRCSYPSGSGAITDGTVERTRAGPSRTATDIRRYP